MKKKILSLLLAALMVFGLAGCASTGNKDNGGSSDIKVGIICIGDENEGYTYAHIAGVEAMVKKLGLSEDQVIYKKNIPEGSDALEAVLDLVDSGCDIIFGNSFGYEDSMIQAAKENPDIEFCHATGYKAASSGLSNMHNYFTNVYESRYVAGVVAGLKLNEMIEKGDIKAEDAKVGYVGAFPYAEVISGYTAFYLGIRSVCESATMEVQYTNDWSDQALEKSTAEALIDSGCVLISQHADTVGAPTACEAAGVPVVGYNISMIEAAPNTALTSASIDWSAYYTYAVDCVINGKEISTDWSQGYAEGADKITELNDKAVAAGTADKVAEVEQAIIDGKLKVFDSSTFTVGGKTLEEYVQTEEGKAFADYVSDGYFHESEKASAPSFAIIIDGITQK